MVNGDISYIVDKMLDTIREFGNQTAAHTKVLGELDKDIEVMSTGVQKISEIISTPPRHQELAQKTEDVYNILSKSMEANTLERGKLRESVEQVVKAEVSKSTTAIEKFTTRVTWIAGITTLIITIILAASFVINEVQSNRFIEKLEKSTAKQQLDVGER